MKEIRNFAKKRVCDVSDDYKVIEIRYKDCITRITAKPDCTLKIEQKQVQKSN